MECYIYKRGESPIAILCEELLLNMGVRVSEKKGCDLAIAPLLTEYIPRREIDEFRHGVLVHHPSLLPAHRGKNSIKDAYKSGGASAGVTWFWADSGYDTGDICEQEAVEIPPGMRPRDYYSERVVPKAVQLLARIIADAKRGRFRRVPQAAAIDKLDAIKEYHETDKS